MDDDLDGRPIWDFATGHRLVSGAYALERLGTGHRCETWLAWSSALWSPVVVKLARPHQADHPRARRSLEREVAVCTGHPALPRLHEDGTRASPPYVVLEYVDGPTLAETVDEGGALGEVDVAVLGTQVLTALLALHRTGRAHLDVKAENVLLRDGQPILIDGGSSRTLGRSQPAGHPVGTLGYAAPEMEDCRPIAASMDLYGLGTVLAEALTGAPFVDRVPLPDVPVAAVVRRLLAPEPEQRGTVEDALVDLAALCGEDRPWPAWADALLRVGASGQVRPAASSSSA